MKVKVIPKCQRVKNRIHEHGDVMELLHYNKYDKKSLVKSLNRTFNGLTDKEYWLGWFHDDEAELQELKE